MKRIHREPQGLIVVIDDDVAARLSIGQMLRLRGYQVELFSSGEAALAWPRLPECDCILSDVKMPGMSGEDFLHEVIRKNFRVPIIMITGHGDVSMAVRCLKTGAYDFVEKPFDEEMLLASVSRAMERSQLRKEGEELKRRLSLTFSEDTGRFGMLGTSKVMQDLYSEIEMTAKSNASVLIVGETGSGKELVARALHRESSRSEHPFIPVNAGALPETMVESELFGHTKGAFTGAVAQRDGKLVSASGGTLFLDEVESLSERVQIQLLRVIEDGLVHPLGSDTTKEVDIRLLLATKVNLLELVRKGEMREDFYHRVVVLTVQVPSLRERREDIPLLLSHFLKEASERSGVSVPRVPEEILDSMLKYPWPGNVRELKNSVERMVLTARDGIAGNFFTEDWDDFPRLLSLPPAAGRLREELERTERSVIEQALREHSGEVTAASQSLGISRRALYERLKRYEIQREHFRS